MAPLCITGDGAHFVEGMKGFSLKVNIDDFSQQSHPPNANPPPGKALLRV